MLDHAGVRVDLPDGWEARARLQPPSVPGERGNLLLHAATVPLPPERGDFGSGVVDVLGPDDVFVVAVRVRLGRRRRARCSPSGACPSRVPSDFSTAVLQRTQLGHSGAQWFFTVAGRPFCLHVVLGSHARRAAGAARVAALLSRTTVSELPR